MTRTDLHDTLREMWDTRPARPPDDRQVAGVAAAIARRYDVDPVLIRVGFAVTGFAGVGALLYILGWIVLPDGAAPGSRPPRRALPTIAFVVAAVLGVGSVVWWDLRALLVGVGALGLLVLLHLSRAQLGVPGALAGAPRPPGGQMPWAATGPTGGTPPAAPGADDPGAPATGAESAATGAGATATGAGAAEGIDPAAVDPLLAQRRPPAWDPLGVVPNAWDLPEPPPAPATPRPPRVTTVTLAAALLAGGLTGLVLLLTGGGATILFGVVLAVLGAGLVTGAFLRAGRGLIPIALAAIAVTWVVLAAPFPRLPDEVRDQRFAPLTAAEVLPRYEAGVGALELDLRGVDLAVPPGGPAEPVRTTIHADAGDVQVRVPPNADVTLRGDIGFGNVEFAGRTDSGPDARIDVTDLGADGVASGRPLVLDVTAGLGNLEVHRG